MKKDIQKEIEKRTEEIKTLIKPEVKTAIDNKIASIKSLITVKARKDYTEQEIDSLYKQVTDEWNILTELIKDVKYKFPLTGSEARFVKKFIYNDAPLDFERVFIANTLVERFLQPNDEAIINAKAEDTLDIYVEVTDSIWIHSLMKEFTSKGFNDQARLFMMVITKIGDISKLYETMDKSSKELATELMNFFQDLEEPVQAEKETV
jgi:hypothetical protein